MPKVAKALQVLTTERSLAAVRGNSRNHRLVLGFTVGIVLAIVISASLVLTGGKDHKTARNQATRPDRAIPTQTSSWSYSVWRNQPTRPLAFDEWLRSVQQASGSPAEVHHSIEGGLPWRPVGCWRDCQNAHASRYFGDGDGRPVIGDI